MTSEATAGERCLRGSELLAWRRLQLAGGGRAADLDWLLELAGGLSWTALQRLRLAPQRRLRLRADLQQLETLWSAHRDGAVPLQYLVGRCPWRDLELAVGPGVLIPRQETELLVELALAATRHPDSHGLYAAASPPAIAAPSLWADLGTGSGCLAIALARAFPEARGWAVDLSPEALKQAQLNLQRQGLLERVSLLAGSWWQPLRPVWGRLQLVLANPPYIPSPLLATLDAVVRDHEPHLALDGGADGLDSVRLILAGAGSALAPGGLLLLEHHHDQSEAVLALMAAVGLEQPTAHRDLEGVRRFASAFGPQRPVPARQGAVALSVQPP